MRTITTLSGETEFCEVFFDNARTPRENLVGELNKGWTMATALLSFERIFIGSPSLAQNALGQLDDTSSLRTVRKDIARMKTILNERKNNDN